MAMHRRQFELIAKTVKHVLALGTVTGPSGDEAIKILAVHLADALSTENANFDRERFLKACGIE